MFYIVPQEDQEPEGFIVAPLNGLRVALPLETNTVDRVLRPLALWLNVRGARSFSKPELIQGINDHLSLLPMRAAVARWPFLDISELATMTHEEVGKKMSWCTNMDRAIARETPEFLPHYGKVREEVLATLTTLNDEAQRKRFREQRKAYTEPQWLTAANREPPEGASYKITIEQVDENHSGYCSEAEDGDLRSDEETRSTVVVYLPADRWTAEQIRDKMEWKARIGWHCACCCDASTLYSVKAWEKIV